MRLIPALLVESLVKFFPVLDANLIHVLILATIANLSANY